MQTDLPPELIGFVFPTFEESVPLAWRIPAPTDPETMLARLADIRREAIEAILAGKLCPVVGVEAVRHLDEVREHGVARLMERGDDVFHRIQAVAVMMDGMPPLPGMPIDADVQAFLAERG